MRRKDRELDIQKAIQIMQKAQYCTLSTSPLSVRNFEMNPKIIQENGELNIHHQIFSIPMSFVYFNNSLFLHTAKSGRKKNFFKDDSLVCIVCVGQVAVPNLFTHEELQHIAVHEPKKLGSHVFTTEYESAIAYGRIFRLQEKDEQNHAMHLLCQKYMPDKIEFVQRSIDTEIKHMNIYEVKLEHISAKAKAL